MKQELMEKAKNLAERPYTEDIMRDETTTGEPIHLIAHPELPGCMAQGRTIEEARVNLEDARFEYILSLLEDGRPVPAPISMATTTTSSGGGTAAAVNEYRGTGGELTFLDEVSRAVQTTKRIRLVEVSLQIA